MERNIAQLPVKWIKEVLSGTGIDMSTLDKFDTLFYFAVTLIISFAVAEIIYRIANIFVSKLLRHKEYVLLSKMEKYNALRKMCNLVPPIIMSNMLAAALSGNATAIKYAEGAVWIYFIVILVISINAMLNAVGDSAFTNSRYHDRPIKGFIQITKAVVYVIAVIIVVSILTNKSPLYLIGGLGAFAAVLMLVAKDSIMGFVGGFLLLENDMVRLGDWIEMNGTSINGTVIDISLTIVKVQNFDNTIVTIPPYSLINNSFINWRGMLESGGRRIARGYNVKIDNIKPCDEGIFRRLSGINALLDEFIAGYDYNYSGTNMGLFRAYALLYLQRHPFVRNDMLIMVRTLTPTDTGLPVQFYCFTTTTDWSDYESIQSEIMEHFASIMPRFGIFPFQSTSSRDTIISGLVEGNFPIERIEEIPYKTTK